MIDCHCHILPGIDDGPADMAQALALCAALVADGVTAAIATPHLHAGRWDNTPEVIARVCEQLRQQLEANNIPLQIRAAAEVRISDELLNWVEHNAVPFLSAKLSAENPSRVMLLEFPHGQMIPGSINLVHWLVRQNICPVIAHPERNKQLQKELTLLKPFIDAGCLVQLTAASVIGEFGAAAHTAAGKILELGWPGIIASDAHNLTGRAPRMSAAKAYVAERCGEQTVARWFSDWQNFWWHSGSC